jgi:plasmid maintenance system antidote protein VapI
MTVSLTTSSTAEAVSLFNRINVKETGKRNLVLINTIAKKTHRRRNAISDIVNLNRKAISFEEIQSLFDLLGYDVDFLIRKRGGEAIV